MAGACGFPADEPTFEAEVPPGIVNEDTMDVYVCALDADHAVLAGGWTGAAPVANVPGSTAEIALIPAGEAGYPPECGFIKPCP